jgi:putative intracellular protease/amidase
MMAKRSLVLFIVINVFLFGCSTTTEPEPEEPRNTDKVLMFLAPDNVYYSEYIVAAEGLRALRYTVDLVSASEMDITPYMLPTGITIEETANTLPGSNGYIAFKTQFADLFGKNWNETLNTVPSTIPSIKSIHSIANLNDYAGILIAGGTGILNLRTDGVYEAQAGISSNSIELVAQKLNSLAIEALKSGKPLLAQCHGASLPVFWGIAGSSVPLMFGETAAGYPEAITATTYQSRGVTLRSDDKVVVSSPNDALGDNRQGSFKLITSRDWYPQTVAHATKVFANILQTYPDTENRVVQNKVLILHGGVVSESNCGPANRANDIPCNYGEGVNLPADFTHIKTMLEADHADEYSFLVSDLNIVSPTLPYTATDQASIENYLKNFDAIIFFKHWSTGVNSALQNALLTYADNGGAILALHHALYNDVDDTNSALNKNVLTTQLFSATSEENGWSAIRETYQLYSTNYGHFISTYHIPTSAIQEAPFSWSSNPIVNGNNRSLSVYPVLTIFDEVYTNKTFVTSTEFGDGVNQVTPLFSNNLSGTQAHTEGFVKLFNKNGDDKVGRVACFQAGESRSSFTVGTPYAQVLRNALVWSTAK